MALVGQLFGGAAEEALNALSTFCKEQAQIARGQQEATAQEKRKARIGIGIMVAIGIAAASMGVTSSLTKWVTKPTTPEDQALAEQIIAGRVDVACGPGISIRDKRVFPRGTLSDQADAAKWTIVQTARRQAGYCLQVGP